MTDYTPYKGTVNTERLRARIDAAMNDICDLHMDAREVAELCLAMEERDALAAHVEALKEAGENAALEACAVSQASIEWSQVCSETPTTSLARHTLLAKAEEAQRIADELREDVSGSHFTEWLDERAAELRQQAEAEH